MRACALPIVLLLAGMAPAGAGSLPVDETTYVEHSLNRDGPLVVEHRPIARTPGGRQGGSSAELAGFCHEGGIIRRRDEFGQPVILRQREVCDNVAPRTLHPGEVDARPTWPEEPGARRRVLRVKG
ncbi:hypothetical protein [Methylobacterium sp. J-090]|uniref:hypothetical protein n=1 Tax=Methylobacterium sp. J-090 TaxID=2836666 RepID=UPI001FBB613E|nr:hypothetical protein [Methylobacterium sp. J-090]MCJ2084103.1 hypothetical protein [Methylobacterium sp. J-090]